MKLRNIIKQVSKYWIIIMNEKFLLNSYSWMKSTMMTNTTSDADADEDLYFNFDI